MTNPDNNYTSTIMFVQSSSEQSSDLSQKILELEKQIQIKLEELKSNKILIDTISHQIYDIKMQMEPKHKSKCVHKQAQNYIEHSQSLLNLSEQLNKLNLNQLELAVEYEKIKSQLQSLNKYHIENF